MKQNSKITLGKSFRSMKLFFFMFVLCMPGLTSWHRGLSCCLGCWHPMGVLVWVQLCAPRPWEAAAESSSGQTQTDFLVQSTNRAHYLWHPAFQTNLKNRTNTLDVWIISPICYIHFFPSECICTEFFSSKWHTFFYLKKKKRHKANNTE